ncbi:MAG: hypothetical protein ACKORK_07605, partial [Gemmatimonadota bacterium]
MASPRTEQALARLADLSPRKIVAELDRYIVGEAGASKAVAIGGDGQVTVGDTVMKSGAVKVRALKGGKVLAGFAGAAA